MAIIALVCLIAANAIAFHLIYWKPMRERLLIAEQQRREGGAEVQYTGYLALALLTFFVIAPIIGYGWYQVIRSLAESNRPSIAPTDIAYLQDPAMWMLPAIFLAIISSAIPLDAACKVIMRDRYEACMIASMRHGQVRYSPWMLPWLNWIMATFAIILVTLGSGWYVVFRSNDVILNRFWSVGEQRFAYTDATDLAKVARITAPNGNVKNRPHVAVRFADGHLHFAQRHVEIRSSARCSAHRALAAEDRPDTGRG